MNSFAISRSPLAIRPIVWIAAVSAFLLFPTIFWPFDYDQGTFAYGGWALLHGAKPYIDFWDIKPPNIFYTYATAFSIFGNSVRAIRILDYLNALVTIVLLYFCALRLWKNSEWKNMAGLFASAAFIVQYYIFGHWNTAQTETYSVPLLLGGFLLVLRHPRLPERPTLGYLLGYFPIFIAGILVGISFYFKFPNALFLFLLIAVIWIVWNEDHLLKWKATASLIIGFILAIGTESAYLAVNHELVPLYSITISETASYVSSQYSGKFTVLQNLRTAVQALDGAWLGVGTIGWMIWLFWHWKRELDLVQFRAAMLLMLGCGLSLFIVQLGNKGYTYHYAILLPWADLLIGSGVGLLLERFQYFRLPKPATTIAFVLGLGTISYFLTSHTSLQPRFNELAQILCGNEHSNGYIAGDSISNYVLQNTNPSDSIFIFGFQPYVYWKTGRAPAVKFINTIHFKPKNTDIHERREFVHTLLCNPPALFLVETADRYTSQGNTNDDSRTTIRERYPELEHLLLLQYKPVDTIQNTIIYRRQ